MQMYEFSLEENKQFEEEYEKIPLFRDATIFFV